MQVSPIIYSRRLQAAARFLLVLAISQTFLPSVALALTGGPSQPEVQSFEPVGTTEMVDVSSGAFNYNIPLLEVEGYPLNLAYHAGNSMDAEASSVGLGWNINPGVVNRNMRGLPDDFNSDQITEENNSKPNVTVGLGGSLSGSATELVGIKVQGLSLAMNLGVNYNNYSGVGFEFGVHPHLSMAAKNEPTSMGMNLGLGLSSSTTGGATITPNLSYGFRNKKDIDKIQQVSLGGAFNRRQGLATLTLGMTCTGPETKTLTKSGKVEKEQNTGSVDASVSFGNPTYSPTAQTRMSSFNLGVNVKLNPSLMGFDPDFVGLNVNGYFSTQGIKEEDRLTNTRAFGTLYAQEHGPGDLLDFNREKAAPYTRLQSTNL